MEVNWQTYYSYLWTFVMTISILVVTSIIILYLLLRTIYKFWYEKDIYSQQNEMTSFFKYLVLAYLSLILLYIITSLSIRIDIIFFNGTIWCWIPDFVSIFYMISRVVLHVTFLARLKTSFEGTEFAYPVWLYYALFTGILICALSTGSYTLIHLYQNAYDSSKDTDCTTNYSYSSSIAIYVAQDLIVACLLSCLFVNRLIHLIRVTSNMYQDAQAEAHAEIKINDDEFRGSRLDSGFDDTTTTRGTSDYNSDPGNSDNNEEHVESQSGHIIKHSKTLSIGSRINLTSSQKRDLMIQARKNSSAVRLDGINNEQQRMLQVIKVVTKFTVLACIASISTILIGLVLGSLNMASAAVCTDGIVNAYCALYCFKTFGKQYETCCYPCHWLGFRCCICFLFEITYDDEEDEHDNNNNNNSNDNNNNNEADGNKTNQQSDKKRSIANKVEASDNNANYKNDDIQNTPQLKVNQQSVEPNREFYQAATATTKRKSRKSIVTLLRAGNRRTTEKHAKSLQLAFGLESVQFEDVHELPSSQS